MRAVPGNQAIRCRKCEGQIGRFKRVDQNKYALVPTDFGAIVRKCLECNQLWLAWMQLLPNNGQKIVMKMIDKEL
jgi:hypothetical protein